MPWPFQRRGGWGLGTKRERWPGLFPVSSLFLKRSAEKEGRCDLDSRQWLEAYVGIPVWGVHEKERQRQTDRCLKVERTEHGPQEKKPEKKGELKIDLRGDTGEAKSQSRRRVGWVCLGKEENAPPFDIGGKEAKVVVRAIIF